MRVVRVDMRPEPDTTVYRTPSGDAYHVSRNCGQLTTNAADHRIKTDNDGAERSGYDPCGTCRYDWLPAIEEHDQDPTDSGEVSR